MSTENSNAQTAQAQESTPETSNTPAAGTVLNGPDGATYTVGQRGRKPYWVKILLGEMTEEEVKEKVAQNKTAAKRAGPDNRKLVEGSGVIYDEDGNAVGFTFPGFSARLGTGLHMEAD